MGSEVNPMVCPSCGEEMNRHAEKLVLPTGPGDAVDHVLGGVVYEMHACPACGTGASRRREPR